MAFFPPFHLQTALPDCISLAMTLAEATFEAMTCRETVLFRITAVGRVGL
jgi:hypothetical protein